MTKNPSVYFSGNARGEKSELLQSDLQDKPRYTKEVAGLYQQFGPNY
jgi:hypothetical protein